MTRPRAIICLTGSELTRGETRDANGAFLATELTMLGVHIAELRLLPDDGERLEEAFSDLSLDTIYLVTDGAPTHVGSSGKGDPEDSAQIVRAIHKRMKELNFLRDVRIFTLGFKGAKEEFLKRLSQDHGGRYVAIE